MIGVISATSPASLLRSVDDTERGLDGRTQRDHLTQHTVNIITSVAHLFPERMIPQLAQQFASHSTLCLGAIPNAANLDPSQAGQFTGAVGDLALAIKLLGNVVVHFDAEWGGVPGAGTACSCAQGVELTAAVMKLLTAGGTQTPLGSPALVALIKQCFLFLRSASSWLAEFLHRPEAKPYVDELLVGMVGLSLTYLEADTDPEIQREAAGLVEQNAEVIRVETLLAHAECAPFAHNVHARCAALPVEVQARVYVAFLSSMLHSRSAACGRGGGGFRKASPAVPGESDEATRVMSHSLLSPLVTRYLELSSSAPVDHSLLQDLITILTAVVRSVWSKSSAGRGVVYSCITPVVERNQTLLENPASLDEVGLQGIVKLSTAVIECMKSSVATHVQGMVQALITVCSAHHSVASVAGVLHILGFLMSGRQQRALVPPVVSFLLHTILPLLGRSEDACAELAEPYFKAIDAAMSNHFKLIWTENQGAAARAILGMLCEALEKPLTCKASLEVLEVLCSNQRLGAKMRQAPNWAPLLDEIILRLLKVILAGNSMLDFDLATNVLHSLAGGDAAVLDQAFGKLMETETRLLPAQRAALVQMNANNDGRTFGLKMQRVCNDFDYFVGLNSRE